MAGVRSTVCVFQPLKYVTGVTILREPKVETYSIWLNIRFVLLAYGTEEYRGPRIFLLI